MVKGKRRAWNDREYAVSSPATKREEVDYPEGMIDISFGYETHLGFFNVGVSLSCKNICIFYCKYSQAGQKA